jgi:hypothetical protein
MDKIKKVKQPELITNSEGKVVGEEVKIKGSGAATRGNKFYRYIK